MGFFGVYHAAGEDHLDGPVFADQPGEALGTARAGDDGERRLRQPEPGVLRGETDVAGHRELAAATESVAVHGGDGGLLEALDLVAEPLHLRGEPVEHRPLPQLPDVRPGHERLLPRPREHHGAYPTVLPELVEGGAQVFHDPPIHGVADVGAVHGDDADPIPSFGEQGLVGHLIS